MQDCAKSSLSVRANKNFENTIQKLNKYSNKQVVQIEKGNTDSAGSIFEEAVQSQKKVKFTLKTKQTLECVPIDILKKDGKLYFHVFYEEKEKKIAASRVVCVEVSKEKFTKTNLDGTVIYKLTGNLAKNYNLRENERVVNNGLPQFETVMIYDEPIPELISRLLRYGELCEVINPGEVRSEIKKIINDTLANYGE